MTDTRLRQLYDDAIERAKAAEAKAARVEALCDEMERQCWMGHEYEQAHPDEPAALLLPVRDVRAALAEPEVFDVEVKAAVARYLDAHPEEKAELDRLVATLERKGKDWRP